MATSPHSGRLLSGYGLPALNAVGASISLDYISNNLLHFADEFAQVRVAWSATVAGFSGGQGYVTGRTSSLTADTWYPIAAYGPFPMPMRQDGSSYPMRVRIAGASSGGAAVKFRLVLAPQSTALGLVNATSDDFIYETATTVSGTGAWLTGTSQGSAAYETLVQIPTDYASSWMAETATLTDVAAAAVGVQQLLVSACIFGSTANAASIPRLSGVYCAEFIGA